MTLKLLFTFLGCVAALSSAGRAADENGQIPSPSQLSCEFLTNPSATAIYDPQPEFAWVCGIAGDAYQQSAFQVVVREAGRASGNEGAIVWDTRRVPSDQSVNVEYAGTRLAASTRYQWQVRTWSDSKTASEWSESQHFQTASQFDERKTSTYPVSKVRKNADEVTTLNDGEYLVDFGQDAFGYIDLELPPSNDRRTLVVRFGEKLHNGRIDRKPGGTIRYYAVDVTIPPGATQATVRPPRDQRNTSGAAIRLPDSIGVVGPFRYVEIDGAAAGLAEDAFTQIRIEYPFDEKASSFECSDESLNEIWKMCKYTIRATTFCGVYVDGDRERIPYEADAYINQLAHYGVDREYALARHSHEYLLKYPTWPTEWKQHSVLMAWADYLYTGNAESLARHYATLKKEKLLTRAETPNGLVDTSSRRYRDIVDWPEGERDGYEMRAVNTVVNSFHYATLTRMADIAEALGHDVDSREFKSKADAFKQAFNSALWNSETGRYVDGQGSTHSSIHANLFPLAFDLVPEEQVQSVIDFLQSRGMQCSVYAAQYLLEGFYANGADDYALQLLASREQRSWYNMIRSGSTIALEAWDQEFKPNLDWNHAWGAAPANLIPMYLVGVRPLQPGFKKIVIQPRPGNLTSFKAKAPSIRGPIGVNYSCSDNACQMEVEIPGNCTADVALPLFDGQRPTRLVCNGKELPIEIRDQHAWLDDVNPGVYKLQATFNPPDAEAAVPAASVQ